IRRTGPGYATRAGTSGRRSGCARCSCGASRPGCSACCSTWRGGRCRGRTRHRLSCRSLATDPYPRTVRGSLVDLLLIVLVVVFAINGYRQGFVVGLLSFLGFFGGAAIGLQLGPVFANFFTSALARVFVSLLTVLVVAIGGQAVASWVGSRIRASIRNQTGRAADDLGGAI